MHGLGFVDFLRWSGITVSSACRLHGKLALQRGPIQSSVGVREMGGLARRGWADRLAQCQAQPLRKFARRCRWRQWGRSWKALGLSPLALGAPPHRAPQALPGSVVALRNAYHRRFVNLHPHDMHFSEEKDANFDMPDWWTFERFTVVDAGNGQIALHNALHNRYVKMGPNGDMTVSPVRNLHDPFPHDWFSERFTVLSAHDIFDGVIGLHNSAHGRMLRMTALTVDAFPVAAQDFTSGLFQESFRIVLAGAGNQGSLPVGLEHGDFSFK